MVLFLRVKAKVSFLFVLSLIACLPSGPYRLVKTDIGHSFGYRPTQS